MNGSTVIIVAESKEEILETLRKDVYAKEGVWDVDNVSSFLAISLLLFTVSLCSPDPGIISMLTLT